MIQSPSSRFTNIRKVCLAVLVELSIGKDCESVRLL